MSGSIVDARDELGETALSCAVAGGHEECVRCLPCLTSQGEGVARSRHRVKAHDVRSFHPGQVSDVLLRELRWSRAAPLDLSEEYSLTLAPARSQSLVFSRAAAAAPPSI